MPSTTTRRPKGVTVDSGGIFCCAFLLPFYPTQQRSVSLHQGTLIKPGKLGVGRAFIPDRHVGESMPPKEPLVQEEGVRASEKYEEWFSELSPLQQATYLLMEKICALNMGVTEALIGLDSPDTLRIIAEDLKFHIDRFLSAFNENMRGGS